MNALLWTLQVLTAILFAASGTLKIFFFEKVTHDVPSFGALPRPVWTWLGILELVCVVLLIVPTVLRWMPLLTVAAAAALALESVLFVRVHVKYKEKSAIVMSVVLGLVMAFVAVGRVVLAPLGR